MEQFLGLIESNLAEVLVTAIMGFISFIGVKIKNLYEEKHIEDTKRKIVKTVVNAVEKLYSDLSGEEKLILAQENIEEMFSEKEIVVSELEMRMLIEESCNCIAKKEEEGELSNI